MSLPVDRKLQCALFYSKCKSPKLVQREYRRVYREEPPNRNNILRWYKQFKETGNVLKRKPGGRKGFSENTVEAVREAYVRNPETSVRACAIELGLKKSTVHKILQNHIRITGHKNLVCKESDSPPKKQQRREDDEDSTLSNAAEPRKNDQSVSDNEDDSPQSETLKPETEEDEAGSDENEDEVILTPSPEDVRESIKQKFLLDMPDDFYDFWEFCSTINKENPEDALSCGGLQLVGPYDVLTGKLKKLNKRSLSQYLCHWRYYHDPPEFQTVIGGRTNSFHVGYFRDDPQEKPVFLGSMSTVKPGVITTMGDNIFSAVHAHFNMAIKDADPFKKTSLQKLQKEIESFANDKEYSLATKTPEMKARDKKKVTNSFHGAGIVVPFDKKTDVGYREIPETNADLKRMLRRIKEAKSDDDRLKRYDDLQELITNVQWANDEGDFGMGLELGIDLLMFGGEEFHSSIRHLLSVAYDLLNRQPFATIIEAHLNHRKADKDNMSILHG